MRFAFLGSGSRGNALVVSSGKTRLLVDCGFSAAETERRLQRLGLSPSGLTAVVITHEHADHVKGALRFAQRHDLPLWMTPGTWHAMGVPAGPRLELFSPHEAFAIGDLGLEPYPMPHDAREPCQFVFSDGAWRLGLLSDTGHVTAYMRSMLDSCDALLLECNHDDRLLSEGPYPASLKRRVSGPLGHLSNLEAAGLLSVIDVSTLQHIVATHLSETNNRPVLARTALAGALGCETDWVTVADQEEGLAWRTLCTR